MNVPDPDEPAAAPPPGSTLAIPLEIVVAPARAFRKIAARPRWHLAYAIIFGAVVLSAYLEFPAYRHVLGTMPDAAVVAPGTLRETYVASTLSGAIYDLVEIFLTASALTLAVSFRNGARMREFPTYVSLVANCTIVGAIGAVIEAIVIRAHAPASFANFHAFATALPLSLAVFDPAATDAQTSFLSQFGLFDIWGNILIAVGYSKLAAVPLEVAIALAFGLDLLFSLLLH